MAGAKPASRVIPGEGADPEEALFVRLNAAYANARQLRPAQCHELNYAFAGYPVRIRVVGDELARSVHPPFGHLATRATVDRRGHLTVDLWDESATAVPRPREPHGLYRAQIPMPMGGVLGLSTAESVARYELPGSTTWFDRRAQHMVGWRVAARSLSLSERTRPLPVVLPLWCLDRDIHVIHAGLVARDGRGILLVGPSGVGKSTVALACACAGLEFLGDDTVGLERRHDGIYVGHSLFSSVRLDPQHLTNFPRVSPHAVASTIDDEPKSLIQLAEVLPDRLAHSVPIHAIVLPSIVSGVPSRISPAPQRDVLRVLARGVLWFMEPNLNLTTLKRMTQFFGSVPSYWLEVGRDVDAIPEQISELVRRICGRVTR